MKGNPGFFGLAVALSLISGTVLSLCPDVDEFAEDIQACRDNDWAKVVNGDANAITTNQQTCRHLQATITCVAAATNGCPDLEANYVATAFYPWTMTSEALQCGTTFNGEPLKFESETCSFYQVSECYEELFNLMYIQPETEGAGVDIDNLKTWLRAKKLLVEDRDAFCDKYIKDRREERFKVMSQCSKELKERCQKKLPMYDQLPENPTNVEEDPYSMIGEVKELADEVCLEACDNMGQKETAANDCRGDDYDDIVADVNAEKNRTANCKELKAIRDCMVDELNDCPYIVKKAEVALTSDFTDALAACDISKSMGTKPLKGSSGGDAGAVVSLTLMATVLLSAMM